ncbi:uncharacterized protein C8orf88 homolog isoform X3 [Rhinoderma darwinii]|uniref:uncharacterized protein C8orf88 homolog isoform X3 n=1 Tax=Rhinoderma darwinii TaxID=43563 RepID=UPI003F67193E
MAGCELPLNNEMGDKRLMRRSLQPARPLRRDITGSGCELPLNNEMGDKRLMRRSLQPARPLRRDITGSGCELPLNNEMGDKRLMRRSLQPARPLRRDITGSGCELPLNNEMGDKRLMRRSLQPARPLRRDITGSEALLMVNFQTEIPNHCRDRIHDHCHLWCSIGSLRDDFKDPVIEKPPVNNKKERITYTRDLLMQLSNSSVSKQMPEYLPDLPIILQHPVSSLYWATYSTPSCQLPSRIHIPLQDLTITPNICDRMTR